MFPIQYRIVIANQYNRFFYGNILLFIDARIYQHGITILRSIYRLMKAGKYKQALNIYRWFLPALELDIHPKLVQYIKLAATSTGLSSEYVRAPRLVLKGEERDSILAIIKEAIKTRPKTISGRKQ